MLCDVFIVVPRTTAAHAAAYIHKKMQCMDLSSGELLEELNCMQTFINYTCNVMRSTLCIWTVASIVEPNWEDGRALTGCRFMLVHRLYAEPYGVAYTARPGQSFSLLRVRALWLWGDLNKTTNQRGQCCRPHNYIFDISSRRVGCCRCVIATS